MSEAGYSPLPDGFKASTPCRAGTGERQTLENWPRLREMNAYCFAAQSTPFPTLARAVSALGISRLGEALLPWRETRAAIT